AALATPRLVGRWPGPRPNTSRPASRNLRRRSARRSAADLPPYLPVGAPRLPATSLPSEPGRHCPAHGSCVEVPIVLPSSNQVRTQPFSDWGHPCAWWRACVRRIVDNLGYRTAEWGAMSDDTPSSPLLVISAHAGDFVWRAAGAIALATERGDRAKVVCLSYGERGESAKAWREGKGLEEIKRIRRAEAEAAAAELGAEIEFLDAGDYPLVESRELVDRLVRVYRDFEPAVVLT